MFKVATKVSTKRKMVTNSEKKQEIGGVQIQLIRKGVIFSTVMPSNRESLGYLC